MDASLIRTKEQLESDRLKAIEIFRRQRLEEPLEAYLDNFDHYLDLVENLIEQTVDLSLLRNQAAQITSDPKLQEVLRYLTGPPISSDDLKIVADASLSLKRVSSDSEMVDRLIQVILDGLDRRRFPWVAENRPPTETEKTAAVLASATIMATRKTETGRRSHGKVEQEAMVRQALIANGMSPVPSRTMPTIHSAPKAGEFCPEATLGTRKADFVVGLWDGSRKMPIECKVSNSSTNSVKRLNNDAAVKAKTWIEELGTTGVVPVAVLSGVYKLHNLEDAQKKGLAIFWAHDLTALTAWIDSTKR